MRRLTFLIATFMALPLFAAGTKQDYTLTRETEAEHQAPRRALLDPYVAANVTETLYHEIGHALIHALDLPVYGLEEYAADVFSIVLMNRVHDRDEVTEMAGHVAQNYRWFADQAGLHRDGLDLWDMHGPDLQRYYNLVCLMYGAEPETREAMILKAELPEARSRTCVEEYDQAARSWGKVLDALAEDAPGDGLVLDWTVDGHDALTDYVQEEIEALNSVMALPSRLNVSVIPCGQSNAFYDAGYVEIQICTELAAELAARRAE